MGAGQENAGQVLLQLRSQGCGVCHSPSSATQTFLTRMFSLQRPFDPLQSFMQLVGFQTACREVFEVFCVPLRVKAAQNELGQQILADFEEAFPSQGTKVNSHFPSPSH